MKKYFNGPSGVYYDFKHDRLILLEYNGTSTFDMKTKKIIGKRYRLEMPDFKHSNLAVTGIESHTLYLGNL